MKKNPSTTTSTTPTDQAEPAFPYPTRSSRFWWWLCAVTALPCGAVLLAGVCTAGGRSDNFLHSPIIVAALAAMSVPVFAGAMMLRATNAELLAALSNRYGAPVTHLGQDRWAIGSEQVTATVRPGPELHFGGQEPAPES